MKIKIIIPKRASTSVELGLVKLTKAIAKKTDRKFMCGLGGEYGYGIDYKNDVFMMHPFCWCEQETCGWCCGDKSNFHYKPTDCEIKWYKWIGRDMEQERKLPKDWLTKCLKSLK